LRGPSRSRVSSSRCASATAFQPRMSEGMLAGLSLFPGFASTMLARLRASIISSLSDTAKHALAPSPPQYDNIMFWLLSA
jgi:hypothetical protein